MTTATRPPAPPKSREVTRDFLEAFAFAWDLSIDLPPPSGGWARIGSPIGCLHAWVPAVEGVGV